MSVDVGDDVIKQLFKGELLSEVSSSHSIAIDRDTEKITDISVFLNIDMFSCFNVNIPGFYLFCFVLISQCVIVY